MTALPRVDYVRVGTVDDALTALREPGARVYAGGTDLLVALKARTPAVATVRLLVDVKSVPEARGITEIDGALRIGALTTAHELAGHPQIARHATALGEAAARTASPALRHRATVGGNLVTPHTAGDVAAALLALDAVVEVAAGGGRGGVEPVETILNALPWPTTALILAVTVPLGCRSAYEKLGERRGFGRARAAVAVARRGAATRIAVAGDSDRPHLAPAPGDAAAWTEPFTGLLERARRRLGEEP